MAWGDDIIGVTTGDGIDKGGVGGAGAGAVALAGAVARALTGGLLIRVGSTYGVGGFAMIEARDNGESSMAGGANTDIRSIGGSVGGE